MFSALHLWPLDFSWNKKTASLKDCNRRAWCHHHFITWDAFIHYYRLQSCDQLIANEHTCATSVHVESNTDEMLVSVNHFRCPWHKETVLIASQTQTFSFLTFEILLLTFKCVAIWQYNHNKEKIVILISHSQSKWFYQTYKHKYKLIFIVKTDINKCWWETYSKKTKQTQRAIRSVTGY